MASFDIVAVRNLWQFRMLCICLPCCKTRTDIVTHDVAAVVFPGSPAVLSLISAWLLLMDGDRG